MRLRRWTTRVRVARCTDKDVPFIGLIVECVNPQRRGVDLPIDILNPLKDEDVPTRLAAACSYAEYQAGLLNAVAR